MKIAFMGAGIMGEAIIKGLLANGAARAEDISAYDVKQARLDEVAARHRIKIFSTKQEALDAAEVMVISVKPQDIKALMTDLKIPQGMLVLSIAAGVSIETLRAGLGHRAIVRSMPNMPAQIGEGMAVWTATPEVTREQKGLAARVLGALGKEIYVAGEDYVDMATAVSGSGPGYVFLIIEALTDAGVHIGLPRAVAEKLTVQTVLGAARAVEVMGKHPAELKAMVVSPGGTTAEGLRELEAGAVRQAFLECVIAAYEKAKALGVRER